MIHPRLRLLAPLLLASAPAAQARAFLVDFGDPGSPSGGAVPAWNDVEPATAQSLHALVDDAGAASGLTLTFASGCQLSSVVNAGVVTPAGGSPLAALGWPASATRDAMWNSSSMPEAELVLAGLDTSATYDLTLLASRTGVGDVRTVRYEARTTPAVAGILDAANNTGEVVTLAGLSSDGAGELHLLIRAAASNTNTSGFYYLNALRITEHPAGTQPPLVGLTENRLDVSRREDKGLFVAELGAYTNDGTSPTFGLTATDQATGLAPTWLDVPPTGTVGTAFSLTLDPGAVAAGTHVASLDVQAAGYTGFTGSVALVVRPEGGALNLLFYGNSYSIGNGGVHVLVSRIAEDAGFPAPKTVARLVGGQNLAFHLNDPGQAAAITQALPLGEEWDFVVLQGYSLEATNALGNPPAFIANAEAIVANVRAHSPGARACFYQTWARGRGHSYYLEPDPVYPSPLQMHLEIEANYELARANLDAVFGPGTGRRAPAGETVALSNFQPELYEPDLSHALPPVTVMAAMTIFTALYETPVCGIDPDFAGSSLLAQSLASFGLEKLDWIRLGGLADRVAAPRLRTFPGSGEDVLLRSTVLPGRLTACAAKTAVPGDTVRVHLASPIGTYVGAPALVWVEPFPTGWPPLAVAPHLEVHIGSGARLLGGTAALAPVGWVGTLVVPPTSEGSLLIQGQVLAPSARTGHAFTTTDGHALDLELGSATRRAGAAPR